MNECLITETTLWKCKLYQKIIYYAIEEKLIIKLLRNFSFLIGEFFKYT
jgi:hypothetical protein